MNYIDEILSLGMRLIKYESVHGHGGTASNAVFGKTIVDCHREVLDYCQSFGMTTYLDPEGMYSYAQTGQAEAYIAILVHLDVVPAGELDQWAHPPFEPVVVEDKLIGRGAADDKVPAAIAVLAVKKLLDTGVELKYPIRIVFGSDEETGFRCIEKYKRMHTPPKFTLIFDGTFPFAFSEKHLLNYELCTGIDVDVYGGESYNSVMDHVVWKNGEDTVVGSGKSAHASRPTLGENALVKLAYMNPDANALFEKVNQLFEPSGHHKLTFLNEVPEKDEITMCLGMVRGGKLYVDVRVPPEVQLDAFVESFEASMKGLDIDPVQMDLLKGSITDVHSDFSKTVLKCYRDMTGDYESQPFVTGSATYGRSYESNCISFGPRMNYHITNTHKPNEFVTFDLIENAFAIYVHTLKTMEEEL